MRVRGSRRPTRRWAAVAALLAALVTTVGGSTPGVGSDGPSDEHLGEAAVLFRDGDLVVFAAKGTGVGAPSMVGDGYTVFRNSSLRDHYTIRLVESPGVERLRPHVEAVAATMRGQVGRSVTVAPGVFPAGSNASVGQIDVRVSSDAPCSGAWLGCAAPAIDDGEVRLARVWINPRLLERSAAEIDNGVRHELGHAFGLGHFNGEFDGHVQTMHATSFDADTYRSGDIAGLRRGLEGRPAPTEPPSPAPPPTSAPPAPTPSSGSIDPAGDMAAAPGLVGIVIRGRAVDPDTPEPISVTVTLNDQAFSLTAAKLDEATGDRHGYEVVWSVGPGTHRVCVTAHNVGGGTDATLGCDDVVVTEGGIGQLGLQTL